MNHRSLGQNLCRQLLAALLALSQCLAPYANAQKMNAEVTPLTQNLSEIEDAFLDLNQLQERAIAPFSPFSVVKGRPALTDVLKYQNRILRLKQQFEQEFPGQLAAAKTPEEIKTLIAELGIYFESVRRIEGLKIYMEEKVEPKTWDSMYSIRFPIDSLAQHTFFLVMSMYSKNFAELPGVLVNLEEIRKLITRVGEYETALEKNANGWNLVITPGRGFAAQYDTQRLLAVPNTTNAVKFALLWMSHALYESQIASYIHLRRPLKQLPDPPENAYKRFVSMQVKREQALATEHRELLSAHKPLVLRGIRDAHDALIKQNKGYVIDESFVNTLDRLRGYTRDQSKMAEVVEAMRKDERSNFEAALTGLFGLLPGRNWNEESEYAVDEGLRMALRWQFLANPAKELELPSTAQEELSRLIDARATEIAGKIRASLEARADISKKINERTLAALRDNQRKFLQRGLLQEAKSVERFETSEVNLGYLISAQAAEIKKLQMSSLVSAWFETIKAQPTYKLGYLKHREIMIQYLTAFKFEQPLADPLLLSDLIAKRKLARWNGAAVRGDMEEKLFLALEKSKDERLADLQALISLGELLKFHNFEDPSPKRPDSLKRLVWSQDKPTVDTLKINDRWLSWMRGSERDDYRAAMASDMLNSSPLLGGVTASGDQLWKHILKPDLSPEEIFAATEQQLLRVEKQVLENMRAVDQQLRDLPTANEPNLKDVSEELRTLMTRTSSIAMALASHAGFRSYFQEIREELLAPGWWRERWQAASSYASKAWLFIGGIFLVQIFSSRISGAARAVESVYSFLAPVFGANLSALQPIFWTMFGIRVSDAAYRGWGIEATRTEILRRFYECGVIKTCVASHDNVANQQALRDQGRTEAVFTLALTALIQAGMWGVGPMLSRRANLRFNKLQDELTPHLERLGLSGGANLSAPNIQAAAQQVLARTAVQRDPLTRELGKIWAEQNKAAAEAIFWREAMKWNRIDARLERYFARLGLNARSWKNAEELALAVERLERAHKAGQISTGELRELQHGLVNMRFELEGAYQAMLNNPGMQNIMQRVWDSSTVSLARAVDLSRIDIKASLDFFRERLNPSLIGQLEEFYGLNAVSAGARVDKLTDQILKDIRANPHAARGQLDYFRQATRTGP